MDIYTGQVNCERWLVDHPAGGEEQVTSVETCGQLDAGWLAATLS